MAWPRAQARAFCGSRRGRGENRGHLKRRSMETEPDRTKGGTRGLRLEAQTREKGGRGHRGSGRRTLGDIKREEGARKRLALVFLVVPACQQVNT